MRWKWGILLTVVIVGCYVNLIYFKPVTPLPSDAELLAHINGYEEYYQAQKIVDRIELDAHHIVVPVQVTEGKRGLSFWQWEKGKWRLVQYTTQTLLSWQLDERDPSTHYLVWYLADWQQADVRLHLIRERYFSLTGDDEQLYTPRVQLEHSYNLVGSGALPFPEQWNTIRMNTEGPQQPSSFSLFLDYVPVEFTFGITHDDAFHDDGGYTYTTGEAESTLSTLMYINEQELECYPKGR